MKPTKLPSGAWRCKVYLGKDLSGKRIYQSITDPDYYECLSKATKIAKHHHESSRDNSLMTLSEAFDKYLNMKDQVLSPSTIRTYDSIKRCHLKSLMDLPLKSLTKNTIQAAMNQESLSCSAKTVQNIYRALTAVLNQFVDTDLQITIKKPDKREINLLTIDQMRTLVLDLRGDKSEIPLLLALFLGLRRSEAMALTHEDFDPSTNTLTINKAMVPDKDGNYVVKQTKTRTSNRKISIHPYLSSRLKEYTDAGIPFYNVAPERPYKRLQQLLDKRRYPHMSMHDLRHQNASIMLAIGIPDKYAMERGGWSSNQVMKNIYQHTIDSQKVLADVKLNDYLNQIIP